MNNFLLLPRNIKKLIVFIIDIALCVVAIWLSLLIRLGEFIYFSNEIYWATILSFLIIIPLFIFSGMYQMIFRYYGWPMFLKVIKVMSIYFIVYLTIITMIGISGIPRSLGILQPIILFFLILGSRFLGPHILDSFDKKINSFDNKKNILIYGAGDAGRQVARILSNNSYQKVVGYVDDNHNLHNQFLDGCRIIKPNYLEEFINKENIKLILIAIPSISSLHKKKIIDNLKKFNIAIRTLPNISDIARGKVSLTDIKDLDIEDLIDRKPVMPKYELMTPKISDKIVMVTGAGGSIGSELCRQIIKLNPKKLILVDINEYNLYAIQSELENITNNIDPSLFKRVICILGSIRDVSRMEEIISNQNIDTIYHSAAYKHVPMIEFNIIEGIYNNVMGTLNIALLSSKYNVSDFVMISTDKAVNPTNIMGSSKRFAEICLQSISNDHKNNNLTKFSMVRFGNVIGSSGSVIPKFRDQIHKGGPITITDPEITRYFMTIPEAAQLVIQASSLTNGGDIFILDMKEPIKIIDLAKRMIHLSGFSMKSDENPNGDIELQFIGLRPGEKLHEELVLGESPINTIHEEIMKAQDPYIPWDKLDIEIKNLEINLKKNSIAEIIKILEKNTNYVSHKKNN